MQTSLEAAWVLGVVRFVGRRSYFTDFVEENTQDVLMVYLFALVKCFQEPVSFVVV